MSFLETNIWCVVGLLLDDGKCPCNFKHDNYMESAKKESRATAFKAGSYTVNVVFTGKCLEFRAYSELAGKLRKFILKGRYVFSRQRLLRGLCRAVRDDRGVRNRQTTNRAQRQRVAEVQLHHQAGQEERSYSLTRFRIDGSWSRRSAEAQHQSWSVVGLEQGVTWEVWGFPPTVSSVWEDKTRDRYGHIEQHWKSYCKRIECCSEQRQWSLVLSIPKSKLQQRQSFEVEIVSISSNGIMIGVAA